MSEFTEFLHEVFAAFDPITARRMFGGYGIYHHGVMFGLVREDVLYLKANQETRHYFESQELSRFQVKSFTSPFISRRMKSMMIERKQRFGLPAPMRRHRKRGSVDSDPFPFASLIQPGSKHCRFIATHYYILFSLTFDMDV